MKKPLPLIAALMAVAAAGASFASGPASTKAATDPLFDSISALDTEVYAAFNTCSEPGQLQKHASYFDPGVEFYHDTGGVTWSREEMLASTQ